MIERARENMHRKHPKTTFVNAHLAMLYYDPAKVAKFLDTFPNAQVDISATVQDLGRAPRLWRDFLIKYQDRVVFGTDGNANSNPDTFWIPHFRYLETFDEYFEHPAQIRLPGGSPAHGRWNISGVSLPDEVLRKIYFENALKYLPTLRASIDRQRAARKRNRYRTHHEVTKSWFSGSAFVSSWSVGSGLHDRSRRLWLVAKVRNWSGVSARVVKRASRIAPLK